MPKIEPFKGVLYNSKKVDISKVVAPPYDVIPPDMQDYLYKTDENNIVCIILGKEKSSDSQADNKYKRAAQFFNIWLEKEIFIQDKEPAIYVYAQEYLDNKKKKTGLGFIARMKIEDPKTSRVLPHEKTFAKPKEDRLNLIREVNANLSSIFTLFEDNNDKVGGILKSVTKNKPAVDVEHEEVRHKLWKITDPGLIKEIQTLMADKDIFIADGHHRCEVATMYRNEMREKDQQQSLKGYDYVMTYFSPMDEKTLTILSTHRLIKKMYMDIEEFLKKAAAYFSVKTVKSAKDLFKEMESAKSGEYLFGVYHKNQSFYLLKLKKEVDLDSIIKEDRTSEWKRLDVSVLHCLLLNDILGLKDKITNEENVIYIRDQYYGVSAVNNGICEAAFFLNPTKINQVRDIAKKGDKMPHKSTYFYPKLLTGLVINKLATNHEVKY